MLKTEQIDLYVQDSVRGADLGCRRVSMAGGTTTYTFSIMPLAFSESPTILDDGPREDLQSITNNGRLPRTNAKIEDVVGGAVSRLDRRKPFQPHKKRILGEQYRCETKAPQG